MANCGRCFELLTNQETTFLLEVASLRELFVEYALEPDCMLTLQCVDTNGEAGLPAIVNNVIEYWQRHSEQTEYLLGFELMNFHGAAILSVCVETDEAEVLGHKEFISRMDGTKMHYGNVIQFSYN